MEYENYVTKEFQMIEGKGIRTCWKCNKEESEDLVFQYHQSEYHSAKYGVGVWCCAGCHKQLHKNEKRAIKLQEET